MPTTEKRPLKVFLCHASTDKPKVRELYRYLKKRGIQPWFDEEDLVGGQDWQVEIPKALATSDAIIICLTKNSVDKEGYIQKEIKFALDKALEMPEGRIFLIPVKFEECEVPFTLSRYQWVDLTIESGYAKMMKALKFRASQLERSAVEVSKKDVEEEKNAHEMRKTEIVKVGKEKKSLFVGLRKTFLLSFFSFIIFGIFAFLVWTGFRFASQYVTNALSGEVATATQQSPLSLTNTEAVLTPFFTNKTVNDGLGSNHVQGVYADSGHVYAATTNGLSISYDGGSSFINKTVDDGLGSENVIGVYAVGENVYAATIGGLSISFDRGDTFINRTTLNGLGSNKINAVIVSQNNVYAATDDGLSISEDNGSTFINKTSINGLGSNLVYSVYYVDNVTYVATSNGLSLSYDNNVSFINKTTKDGLGSNVVYGVFSLGEIIYAATESGLSVSSDGGKTFLNLTGDGQFSWVNGVYAIGNQIFGATLWSDGLAASRDNGDSFVLYTLNDGLGSNSIYHVYANSEMVYVATSNGLSLARLEMMP